LTTNSNNRAAIYYRAGDVYINGSVSFTGSSYTNNDVIGVAVDMDALTIRFYKNNTAQGSGTSSLSAMTGPFVPAIVHLSGSGSAVAVANFGQRAFAYTAPSGFKALCTQNLPTPTIGATSTTQANESFADFHVLEDVIRGATKSLSSDTTTAEVTRSTALTAFTSDGFSVGSDTLLNYNAQTFVAWNWKANGAGSSNTAGTITSTVSANTTSGFSIVTYTGNGTANATIGHGLGVTPAFIITKSRSDPFSTMGH